MFDDDHPFHLTDVTWSMQFATEEQVVRTAHERRLVPSEWVRFDREILEAAFGDIAFDEDLVLGSFERRSGRHRRMEPLHFPKRVTTGTSVSVVEMGAAGRFPFDTSRLDSQVLATELEEAVDKEATVPVERWPKEKELRSQGLPALVLSLIHI